MNLWNNQILRVFLWWWDQAVGLDIVLPGLEACLSCILEVKYTHLNHLESVTKQSVGQFTDGLVSSEN